MKDQALVELVEMADLVAEALEQTVTIHHKAAVLPVVDLVEILVPFREQLVEPVLDAAGSSVRLEQRLQQEPVELVETDRLVAAAALTA
jgi:hypothetical protein